MTFDCWSTLIHEVESRSGPRARAEIVAEFTGRDVGSIENALRSAWRRHQVEWHRRRVFDGRDMTRSTLDALGVELSRERFAELCGALEEEIESHEIRAIEGAADALERLKASGVRIGLVCDTGFSPGRVVRRLLGRVGLLPLLEVTIFSEELGVPKPDPRAFGAALAGLGVPAQGAVHVGDLRRSDIAGARASDMGAVRFAGHHDDAESGPGERAGVIDCRAAECAPVCPRPEGHAVIRSYAELCPLLGYG